MPQNVLGLDIGNKTIKAVFLSRKGFSGGRIAALRVLDIEACGGVEPALQKLTQEKFFSDTVCVALLPSSEFIFRKVSLPFRDENKIRKTLLFELEPLIPLPIEEVIADYLTIPDDGIFTAVAAKKTIAQWIEKLDKYFMKVPILDASTAALAAQTADKNKAGGLLLDIGGSSTSAVFFENGVITQARTISFGGENVTRALARELAVSIGEAEKIKIHFDANRQIPETLECCRVFCRELKNTLEYLNLNGLLKQEPADIIYSGGGSLFAPLIEELKKTFSCPVMPLNLLQKNNLEIEESMKASCHPLLMNTALAAALRFSSRRSSFNFRREEFAAPRGKLDFQQQKKWAVAVGGILIALAVVNQLLDYHLKRQQFQNIKKQMTYIFKKDFPEARQMVDPVQQLQAKLEENKKNFGFLEKFPEATAADFLKEISAKIPPSLDVVVHSFSYDSGVIALQGEAKDSNEVSAVKNALAQSPLFQDVAIGQTALAKNGGRVDFNLRITVNP